MLLLRGTAKVRKLFALDIDLHGGVEQPGDFLLEWYLASVDWLNRGRSLIVAVNAASRFTLLLDVRGVRGRDPLAQVLGRELRCQLTLMGVADARIDKAIGGMRTVSVAKTASRSMLSHINNLRYDLEWRLFNEDGVPEPPLLRRLEAGLNQRPVKRFNYKTPKEVLEELLVADSPDELIAILGGEDAAPSAESVCYRNRKGQTYYLHERPGKGGRTSYVMKKQCAGAMTEIPAGREIYEDANGRVYVRKVIPSQLLPLEEELVLSCLHANNLEDYRIQIKGDVLTILESDQEIDAVVSSFQDIHRAADWGVADAFCSHLKDIAKQELGDGGVEAVDEVLRRLENERLQAAIDELRRNMTFSPIVRFILRSPSPREFAVERMTFIGEGGWWLLRTGSLAELATWIIPHLGRESFFELI